MLRGWSTPRRKPSTYINQSSSSCGSHMHLRVMPIGLRQPLPETSFRQQALPSRRPSASKDAQHLFQSHAKAPSLTTYDSIFHLDFWPSDRRIATFSFCAWRPNLAHLAQALHLLPCGWLVAHIRPRSLLPGRFRTCVFRRTFFSAFYVGWSAACFPYHS